MEYIILAIWLIWFTQAYKKDVKIQNNVVLVLMALIAAGVFFGVIYGITYIITYLMTKIEIVIWRPILGIIISSILFLLSFLDYKRTQKTDKERQCDKS